MIPHKNIIIGGNIRLISFILRCFSYVSYKYDSLCMRNAEFVFLFLGSPKSRSRRHNNQMLQSNKMARIIRLLTAAALYAVHCACVVLVQSLEPRLLTSHLSRSFMSQLERSEAAGHWNKAINKA